MTARRCVVFDKETTTRRSFFDWQPPAHVLVEQHVVSDYGLHLTIEFTAKCEKCQRSSRRSHARADAIQELHDMHPRKATK